MNKHQELLFHLAVWLVLFLSPLSFVNHGNGVSFSQFLVMSASPLAMLVVFYANYLWLTPSYFVEGEKKYFWLVNAILCITIGIAQHYWIDFARTHLEGLPVRHHPTPTTLQTLLFIFRNIFYLTLAAVIATSIKLSLRWYKSEEARHEAEKARAEAELRNLRNQISPHFLLNTLNNIYALTAFNSQRAQEAIEQLSKLLRHMLYDNQQSHVALTAEVQFLRNYVDLMKIRLASSVDVTFNVVQEAPDIQIAPLLFISLVENAFKHGISPSCSSFIHIDIKADADAVVFSIENSNFPKNEQDRSGHGIGLSQVQRRLELAYPGKYSWERGVSNDGTTYHSRIAIHL